MGVYSSANGADTVLKILEAGVNGVPRFATEAHPECTYIETAAGEVAPIEEDGVEEVRVLGISMWSNLDVVIDFCS